MSGLAQIQAALGARILATLGEGNSAQPVALRGLDIYHQAYRLRLIEVLYNDFPIMAQATGDIAFSALARGYVERHRSTHYSVRWFGREFPAFVLRNSKMDERRSWAELARLEWLLGEAFDARDAPAVGADALATIPGQDWPSLTLSFHPSLRTLRVRESTLTWWSSIHGHTRGADCPRECASPSDERATVVIWRVDTHVRYLSMKPEPAAALMAALAGASVSVMCEALSRHYTPDQVPVVAAGLLAEWLGAGLVSAVVSGD